MTTDKTYATFNKKHQELYNLEEGSKQLFFIQDKITDKWYYIHDYTTDTPSLVPQSKRSGFNENEIVIDMDFGGETSIQNGGQTTGKTIQNALLEKCRFVCEASSLTEIRYVDITMCKGKDKAYTYTAYIYKGSVWVVALPAQNTKQIGKAGAERKNKEQKGESSKQVEVESLKQVEVESLKQVFFGIVKDGIATCVQHNGTQWNNDLLQIQTFTLSFTQSESTPSSQGEELKKDLKKI